ncbi:MAG: energy-coupling factor transporter ATPase [Eubacteriales bacterium]|nr:energy-coupling factor transporter ATPase [Eubacteriales bacterium]
MEIFKIENLTFTYPENSSPAIDNISVTFKQGEFVTLCGKSGCGKTTLLRHLKPALTPYGIRKGDILFEEKDIRELDTRKQAQKIGYVLQSPDNQIVTDKVWHELSFGLESLGVSTGEIRSRVAEMASFFGIQDWFHKKVSNLSGGQKQLLNLASVMVMQPSVIILDEPTSQLDPIAAQDFLETIAKINRELGTTIILSEHRLEEALPLSDRMIVMDSGKIIADGTPDSVGQILKETDNPMFKALPAPMRIHASVESELKCPVTVREGRGWLEEYSKVNTPNENLIPNDDNNTFSQVAVELKDIYFRYEKDQPDVVEGLSLKIYQGEFYAIVGGNGTGKTTTLNILSGLINPYSGQVKIFDEELKKYTNPYNGLLGVLPQNPQTLFVKKTVEEDLWDMLSSADITDEEKEQQIKEIANICEINHLMDKHPFDLSGGEQQKAALAKVLLLKPGILLMDEPTKGIDADFKGKLAEIIYTLKNSGVTVIIVSHDIEFCAKYADRCAMFFDGKIISEDSPKKFFTGKNFYTTATNRMARGILPSAVLAEDVILACGGKKNKKSQQVYMTIEKYQKPQIAKVRKGILKWL